ncbi:MAG TPA: redoxin domain-containing protein [Methylophilaceae bacterium]|jgi:thiol-disulfide isomerase/thioredoxin
MSKTARVLIPIVLILCLVAFFLFRFSTPNAPATTQALFAASFPDAQNKSQSLSQWRGKVIVLNFWASWCPPCREEMPAFDVLQTKYASKNVQFVGISAEDVSKLNQFSKDVKVGYPLLAGDFDAMSLAQYLGNDKSILPYTVVVDKAGKIVKVWFGIVDNSELEKTLAPLI